MKETEREKERLQWREAEVKSKTLGKPIDCGHGWLGPPILLVIYFSCMLRSSLSPPPPPLLSLHQSQLEQLDLQRSVERKENLHLLSFYWHK